MFLVIFFYNFSIYYNTDILLHFSLVMQLRIPSLVEAVHSSCPRFLVHPTEILRHYYAPHANWEFLLPPCQMAVIAERAHKIRRIYVEYLLQFSCHSICKNTLSKRLDRFSSIFSVGRRLKRNYFSDSQVRNNVFGKATFAWSAMMTDF